MGAELAVVVITGAAGRIGTYLRSGLRPFGWELRLLDRRPIPDEPTAVVADIRDPQALASVMQDAFGVVHLAGAISPRDSFGDVLAANIEGTHAVLEAARVAGVERFVFASSNHANGFAPRSAPGIAGAHDRPDSFYGVSKVFGESLCRLYHDRFGIKMACLRIGSCFDVPRVPRMLGSWLSPRDAAGLVDACLRSPELDYKVFYAISGNTRRWWDLAPMLELGYVPKDDAEAWAEEVLAEFGGIDPSDPDEPTGGDAARQGAAEPAR
ncbi:MAG: NAD(P)-dependent oxidoreductase [Actinomycetota bacterium]|nr:NAD(P)-dependent oxidoreductase [Actinomycetota bacterium]